MEKLRSQYDCDDNWVGPPDRSKIAQVVKAREKGRSMSKNGKHRRDDEKELQDEYRHGLGADDNDIPEIDLTQLERQWVEQPKLAERFSDKLAFAKRRLAEAEQEKEETAARVKLDIRKKPEEYGLDKTTEGSVQEALVVSQAYKDAGDKVIEAKFQVDWLVGRVSTVSTRKTALENEVQLWLASYFSTPKAPAETKDKMREHSKEREKERRRSH